MNELQRQAAERSDRIGIAIGDVLAERYGAYFVQSDDTSREEMRDYFVLGNVDHKPINDLRVRVHIESADVVSVYTIDGDGPHAPVRRSARLTQMPETAVAVLVAHELTGDGQDTEAER